MINGIDLFCGAGGLTTGAEMSGLVRVVLAVNHWDRAVITHQANHLDTRHLCMDVDDLDPRGIQHLNIDILLASPECTNFCNAKGGQPYSEQSRATAWHVVRFAEFLRPRWIVVENVREFLGWGPLTKKGRPMKSGKGKVFQAWKAALESLDYKVEHRILNAADYGAATSRERLFIVATRARQRIQWPEPTVSTWKPAADIIDWSLPCPSIFDRKKPLVPATVRRIRIGMEKYWGEPFVTILKGQSTVRGINDPLPTVTTQGNLYLTVPFLVKLYGTGTVKPVTVPLDTITAGGNKFGLVKPFLVKYHAGGKERAHSVEEPLRTIDTQNRFGLVQPFLVKYFGTATARPVDIPLDTITTKDRFGLVSPDLKEMDGDYMLDIGFRMLQPHELKAAMGFPDDYIITGTKADQRRQIGNAVAPPVGKAIVEANVA